ncbi:MAG: hypothetical protein ACRD1N_05815 [Terriglobia bacterium]
MSTRAVLARNTFLEPAFFDRAEILWKQLEGTLGPNAEAGSNLLRRVASESRYAFLLATAEQVFTQDLALGFLNHIRRWARDNLGVHHVSTPQVHIYVARCGREMAPDATPASWHYLYSLARGEAPNVRLLREDKPQSRRFGITLSPIDRFQLGFNHLLVHQSRQAYALDIPKRKLKPLEGAVLLHGYLW